MNAYRFVKDILAWAPTQALPLNPNSAEMFVKH
jgi:hypothetical protein